ncbi:MAG: hydantoinase/oxoprolinase family protein [Alphaproteobacteria bacterium]|nr:hydantoinase/oxoprolinase family protein [Alphaproteobacteria bacterium]
MTVAAGSGLRVGVDIGGTFTDLVFLRPDGMLDRRKRPSTPNDYSRAIVEGIADYCAELGVDGTSVTDVVHATTVATNAILERKGASTGLLTTEGFRDVLELRRMRIPLSYDLDWKKPEPLVERALRLPVRERMDARGNVLIPLDMASVDTAIDELAANDVEAVAICFLHAYRNADHEKAVAKRLRERMPRTQISLSSDVLPEMLEFERTSTTVVNAYVGPLIGQYLDRLRSALAAQKIRAPILVMQSNGGLISASSAAERPVTIIESGPAAGVVAAQRLAGESGYPNVITLDMGGTTTKASIIERGEILRSSEYEVGSAVSVSSRLVRGGGYLLRIPVIDISEVGAGGGSIATLDAGGSLRVGPRSAGAVPGPACYGLGNPQPTVTDANLILGYISPTSLAGGTLAVDAALAETAIRDKIAGPAKLSVLDAAYGIHTVANSNMVRAIKSVSVERGRDPLDFAMMAFGGAGPIHAAGLASQLGIRRVLIPPAPGVFSAFGLLRAEIEHHTARTVLTSTRGSDLAAVEAVLAEMRADLLRRTREEGLDPASAEITRFADLRYRGQSSELTVAIPCGMLSDAVMKDIEERFEAEFERTYGHRADAKAFELVTIRLVLRLPRQVEHGKAWRTDASIAKDSERLVYFGPGTGQIKTAVRSRDALRGQTLSGPLLIQEYDTTIVVPPNCTAGLDEHANVVIAVSNEPRA